MKTILTIALAAIFMLGVLAPMAFAQEATNDTSAETEAELGLNETVTNGQIFWKQTGLWFTFNQEKKMNKELEIARLRLIQAKIAAKNNDSDAVEKALEAHERIMNRIQSRMDAIDGASSAEGLNASAVKLVGLERAIQVHERRISYLNTVLEDSNLTDAQRARIELRLEKAENNTAQLTALQERKMNQVKTKLMAVSNLTEDEADDLVQEVQGNVAERVEQRLENRAEIRATVNSDSNDSEDYSDNGTQLETGAQTQSGKD